MKRKLITFFLILTMLLCVSACGDDTATNESNPSQKQTTLTTEIEHIHQYAPATCETPLTCSCGETVGLPLDHDFEFATCTSPKICKRCAATQDAPLGHQYKEATCVSPKICTLCGSVADDPLGHNFVGEECSRCGKLDRIYLYEDVHPFDDTIIATFESQIDNFKNEYFEHYTMHANSNSENGYRVEFHVEQKFTYFNGTIFLSWEKRNTQSTSYIEIYGDGKILYRSSTIRKDHEAQSFSIDISGVSVVEICFGNSLANLTNAYFSN